MYGSDVTGTMGYANFIGSEQEGSYTRIEIRFHLSNESYPNISPSFEITELDGIAQSYKSTLISELSQQASLLTGTPMLLPLLSFLQEWIDNYSIKNKEKLSAPVHILTKILQDTTLSSTPHESSLNVLGLDDAENELNREDIALVTEEAFLEWKTSFYAHKVDASKPKTSSGTQKLTGRQLFERNSVEQQSDSAGCLAEDEEVVEVNFALFHDSSPENSEPQTEDEADFS
ncbi:hypothetical protein DI09_23p20 [Mitosporidium daphniae]|uniref:RWD domain-containing protein n=1 Tax=Mitosporidium daphniae TaxID=1485682 RepID=A0A098VSH5_9MICR|nr:uncharacterized protein DI09_23p20 [Mitosporidium daphniae]KGG51927.1 hypothetical protein DI09_23p20 [Mitosporidium daphniae]|eukprot:XP_013238381.1 uncharacterized protein DI09_23p20 [Mitosporidium daphniae]